MYQAKDRNEIHAHLLNLSIHLTFSSQNVIMRNSLLAIRIPDLLSESRAMHQSHEIVFHNETQSI